MIFFWGFIVSIVAIILIGLAIYLVSQKAKKAYFLSSLRLRPLTIRLPQKFEKADKEAWMKEMNLSSQLMGILANLKVPFALEAAVPYIGEQIEFYIAVPGETTQFVIKQIQGLWNDAQVEESDDYNIFNVQGETSGVYLKQALNPVLPLRVFEEAGTDTFLSTLSSLSQIESIGEGVAVQVMVRPAPEEFKKEAVQLLYRLKQGEKLETILQSGLKITLQDIQKALAGGETASGTKPVLEEETIKAVEKKLAKPIFAVNVRIAASAPNNLRVNELLQNIAGAYDEQFTAPFRNDLVVTQPADLEKFIDQFIFRVFDESQKMILGSDELVSLFHLPTSVTEVPKIKWLKAREAQPPVNLPSQGLLIGENVFRGERRPVYITDDDRRRHIYIIGQTGTGKSNLLVNMALNDIYANKGVAIVDPHGDLVETLAGLIPEQRLEDVIIFNPGDLERPVGLNMLEYDFNRPEEKTFIVNEMQSIFNKLFPPETMGPMFEQYMRNALLLLMEDAPNEPATLLDVPKVFTDASFREKKLFRCQNPVVKDFWEREAIRAGGEASLQNITPYITSKFNNFIANDYIRPIISQPKSAFSFREVMDSGKILLVNLSKGRIGDINANLLGMIIVGKLLMAALSRVDIEQEKRRDFNLFIDEFQNFTTDSIAVILSEARKYRLNLVIAHQFIAQLTDKIREAIFGNVGSILAFRIGAKDAEELVKQFEPIFSKNDLINIDNFNAYAKLLINGEPAKPFNLRTLPAPRSSPEVSNYVKELSRNKYGLKRG
jgi:hypothetical protein